MANVTWYAVYESNEGAYGDGDYTPCDSQQSAQTEAATYLPFSSGERSAVYIVAVPDDICTAEEWSLWDHIGNLPPESFVWLHRGNQYN